MDISQYKCLYLLNAIEEDPRGRNIQQTFGIIRCSKDRLRHFEESFINCIIDYSREVFPL